MRVLITGADGFVGGYLSRHLLESDPTTQIIGTVHPSTHGPQQPVAGVCYVSCDIVASGGTEIRDLIREKRPDRIFHLAGRASAAETDRVAIFEANVDGTLNVIRGADGVVPGNRVHVASTGYVYGACNAMKPAREDTALPPLDELNLYSQSKVEMERRVQAHGGAMITRAFNHTGPGQTTAFAVPAFCAQIAAIERGHQCSIAVGNLEAIRDFLDVRDVVRAYALLIDRAEEGQIYNVCSGVPRKMADVLSALVSLAKVPVSVANDPGRARTADNPFSVGDNGRLVELTGWEPEISFERTLSDTLEWWRSQTQ